MTTASAEINEIDCCVDVENDEDTCISLYYNKNGVLKANVESDEFTAQDVDVAQEASGKTKIKLTAGEMTVTVKAKELQTCLETLKTLDGPIKESDSEEEDDDDNDGEEGGAAAAAPPAKRAKRD